MMQRTPMVATGGPSMQGPARATGGPSMAGGRPMVASGGPLMQGGRPMIGSSGPSLTGNPMMQRPGMQPMGSTFGMPQLNRTPVWPIGYGPQQGMVNSSMPMQGAPMVATGGPSMQRTPMIASGGPYTRGTPMVATGGHPMQGPARVVNTMAQGRQALMPIAPTRRGGGLY